jgi:hypothetical protein
MEKHNLTLQEQAAIGANTLVIITADDLTEATANTAQTLQVLTRKAGQAVRFVKHVLVTPFKDASDAAFNTCAAVLGDGGNTSRYMGSTELNENGTEIKLKFGQSATGIAALTSATVTTPNGSDAGTTQTLANALKAEINKVIADLGAIRTELIESPFYIYGADDTVDLVVSSMADKSLVNIDTGELHLFFDLQ